MTKLFRNMRKLSLSRNSSGKYFRYAVGEILLVVLGILIALQVSNWNDIQKREKQEIKFLQHIKEDLTGMMGDIRNDYHALKLGEKSHFRILNYFSENKPYQDSICFDFYWLTKDEYVYPVRSTYDAIKEEGFSIIENDSIRKGIQIAYENIFPRISKENPFYPDIEAFFSEYLQNEFTVNEDKNLVFEEKFPDYTISYPYPRNSEGKQYFVTVGFHPKDFQKIKKDQKFKVLMRQAYTYRAYKLNRYRNGMYYVENLLGLLDRELNRRK